MGRVPWPVKWLVAPVLAAALGYLVIGPRLAGKVKLPDSVKERVGKLVPIDGGRENAEPAASPPPTVTVDAQPAPSADETPRRRRRRHREDE